VRVVRSPFECLFRTAIRRLRHSGSPSSLPPSIDSVVKLGVIGEAGICFQTARAQGMCAQARSRSPGSRSITIR
jgi:hypothetical protein